MRSAPITTMTDRRQSLVGLDPLDLSTIQSTSSLPIEQRVERATQILDEVVSPTFTPQDSLHTPMQPSPLKRAVERALRIADKAATPQTDPTPMTPEWPSQQIVPDIMEGKTTSDSLDLNDPHWTETRQQQMLHQARIPPQPLSLTETSLVDDIKK